ncbi:MAG TPA: hypothetical protein VKS79_24820, partial [Gemmataceae bacterium]|nr:hypothetical protein [Gemmataceae bacterium]
VDELIPGSITVRTDQSAPLRVAARMESALPPGRLEIIRNGEVVGQAVASQATAPPYFVEIELELPITGSCWLAARCAAAPESYGFAHTSPVFVRCNRQMPTDAAVTRNYFEALQRTEDWVETVGRFEIPRRKEQLLAIFKQAQQALSARLE